MIVNIVTPAINRTLFSGGLFCVMKYADGLAKKGHIVNVVPGMYSEKPEWINCDANILLGKNEAIVKSSIEEFRNSILQKLDRRYFFYKSKTIRTAIDIEHVGRIMPEADITIATAWETVEPVLRYGSGERAYFIQHFEPLFFTETSYEKLLCELSYQMPLNRITNSQWLFDRLSCYLAAHDIKDTVYKCTNAVDLENFRKMDAKSSCDRLHVRVISYGGRCVAWKGFSEMAKSIAIARDRLPEYEIEWLVYGDAELPPDNAIAHYVQLGFLNPQDLCYAYNKADILLSASWYESFPLFPIEAMACGLAVITTQNGTEEYASHGVTAHVVEPKNVSSITDGLVKLITDHDYRSVLAENGLEIAQQYNWSRSVDTMESILFRIINNRVNISHGH